MADVDLLPCPFCGGDDIRKSDNGHVEWLYCADCDCKGPWIEPPEGHYFTGTELADQWNARDLARENIELRAEREALRQKVEIAAIIFEEYARLHRAKETPDGERKAKRNDEYAAEMRTALARASEPSR